MTLDELKKNLAWFGAGSGASIPAISFFTNHTPPLFPEIGLIITPIAGALIYVFHKLDFSTIKSLNQNNNSSIKAGSILLLVSLLSLSAFFVIKSNTTVSFTDTNGNEQIYQVGFHKMNWSLTENGTILKQNFPDKTLKDWMLMDSAFVDDGPSKIWKKWTINLAGIILILAYLIGFLSWASAFSILAKNKASTSE